jgi:GMP synthase (glutamine-hydrolysing)
VVEPDKIFVNIPNFQVFESHRWVVREPINEFKVLARSKDGVEVIKHKNKPIYAVQFHPEMFMDQTCGDECFNNFLNSVV